MNQHGRKRKAEAEVQQARPYKLAKTASLESRSTSLISSQNSLPIKPYSCATSSSATSTRTVAPPACTSVSGASPVYDDSLVIVPSPPYRHQLSDWTPAVPSSPFEHVQLANYYHLAYDKYPFAVVDNDEPAKTYLSHRKDLVEWMSDVQNKAKLEPEVFHLAVRLMDEWGQRSFPDFANMDGNNTNTNSKRRGTARNVAPLRVSHRIQARAYKNCACYILNIAVKAFYCFDWGDRSKCRRLKAVTGIPMVLQHECAILNSLGWQTERITSYDFFRVFVHIVEQLAAITDSIKQRATDLLHSSLLDIHNQVDPAQVAACCLWKAKNEEVGDKWDRIYVVSLYPRCLLDIPSPSSLPVYSPARKLKFPSRPQLSLGSDIASSQVDSELKRATDTSSSITSGFPLQSHSSYYFDSKVRVDLGNSVATDRMVSTSSNADFRCDDSEVGHHALGSSGESSDVDDDMRYHFNSNGSYDDTAISQPPFHRGYSAAMRAQTSMFNPDISQPHPTSNVASVQS